MEAISQIANEINEVSEKVTSMQVVIGALSKTISAHSEELNKLRAYARTTREVGRAFEILSDLPPQALSFVTDANVSRTLEDLRHLWIECANACSGLNDLETRVSGEKKKLEEVTAEQKSLSEYEQGLRLQLKFKITEMDKQLGEYRQIASNQKVEPINPDPAS